MSPQLLEQMLENIERTGRGWVHGGEIPPCDVWLDGVLMKQVISVNRKRGMLRMTHTPVKTDKHGKGILFFTLRGVVTLAPLGITEGAA